MGSSSSHETIITSILLLDTHFSVKTQSPKNNSPGESPPPGTTQIVHFVKPHGFGLYNKCLSHYQFGSRYFSVIMMTITKKDTTKNYKHNN